MNYKENYENALAKAEELHRALQKKNASGEAIERSVLIEKLETIFPELKDDDEKIRNDLIAYFKNERKSTDYEFTHRFIPWLEKQAPEYKIKTIRREFGIGCKNSEKEKQGEQKPTEWEPQTGDTFRKKGTTSPTYHLCDKREDGITFGFVENREVGISGGEITIFALKNDYELVERPKSIEDVVAEEFNRGLQTKVGQKPTSWSEEDESLYRQIEGILSVCRTKSLLSFDLYKKMLDLLKSLKDKVQPKQEWKQENVDDLTDFENAMMHIGSSFFGENAGLDPNDTNAIKEQANLLLGLVPSKEWSKEDERIFSNINLYIRKAGDYPHFDKENIKEAISWLQSLKLQSTWKPSDEQMDALRYVTNFDYGGYKAILVSLYEQLKKLKG